MLAKALRQSGVLCGIAAHQPYLVRAQERLVLHQVGDIRCALDVNEDGLAAIPAHDAKLKPIARACWAGEDSASRCSATAARIGKVSQAA